VKKFNLEPERGLAYLEEEGFFSHTPQAVARFLFRQERLSKKQIGQNISFTVLQRREVHDASNC
jgi:hypothetical protein